MADEHHQHYQLQPIHGGGGEGMQSILPEKGPSTSQVLAVVTVLPVGGTLLGLAGITLVGTLIGLAVTTPLFIICSPVLLPAALVIGLAMLGFLTSGAFGITALSSLSWMVNYSRRMRDTLPHRMEQAKRRVQDTAGQVGQKAREAGHGVQGKAHEMTRGDQEGRGQEGGRT